MAGIYRPRVDRDRIPFFRISTSLFRFQPNEVSPLFMSPEEMMIEHRGGGS